MRVAPHLSCDFYTMLIQAGNFSNPDQLSLLLLFNPGNNIIN